MKVEVCFMAKASGGGHYRAQTTCDTPTGIQYWVWMKLNCMLLILFTRSFFISPQKHVFKM